LRFGYRKHKPFFFRLNTKVQKRLKKMTQFDAMVVVMWLWLYRTSGLAPSLGATI